MSWKDTEHPQAGGAELVSNEIIQHLIQDNHHVTLVTSRYPGSKAKESRYSGKLTIYRRGNRLTVYWHAYRQYKQHLQATTTHLIDEMNTVPFFTRFYAGKQVKRILFVHQLCRQVWFYQLPKIIGFIGYLLEPAYLWLLRNEQVITVSESTRHDLMRYGFALQRIHLIREGIPIRPVNLHGSPRRYSKPTLLSLGSVRPMKQTLHQLIAFEKAKQQLPDLQLIIAGSYQSKYGQKVARYIAQSPYQNSIELLGPVSMSRKKLLLQKSHALLATSVKEGWGLTVSEAASQTTPTIGYDVDGLRDSVQNRKTGLLCQPNPESLADAIIDYFDQPKQMASMSKAARKSIKSLTFDNTYKDFLKALPR